MVIKFGRARDCLCLCTVFIAFRQNRVSKSRLPRRRFGFSTLKSLARLTPGRLDRCSASDETTQIASADCRVKPTSFVTRSRRTCIVFELAWQTTVYRNHGCVPFARRYAVVTVSQSTLCDDRHTELSTHQQLRTGIVVGNGKSSMRNQTNDMKMQMLQRHPRCESFSTVVDNYSGETPPPQWGSVDSPLVVCDGRSRQKIFPWWVILPNLFAPCYALSLRLDDIRIDRRTDIRKEAGQ